MKIKFYGGARAGTGSCCLVEVGDENVLVDCGLQRGQDEFDNNNLGFYASHIDHIIATHGRIDYGGRLPLLVRDGFYGNIFTTTEIKEVLGVMLEEAAVVLTDHAEWNNRKGKRKGTPPLDPLYTVADVSATMQQMKAVEMGEMISLSPNIKIRLVDGGHYLCSTILEMWATEGGVTKKIVFSGSLGNQEKEGGRAPSIISEADYVVLDAVCGDFDHPEGVNFKEDLCKILDSTFARGGDVIIPASAAGHCFELLLALKAIKEEKLLSDHHDFPAFFDNGVVGGITLISKNTQANNFHERVFWFEGLSRCSTLDQSKALNESKTPKVIIAAMDNGERGRVTHHLKHHLWRKNDTILLVGKQEEGSICRRLLDGITHLAILGEEINVNANVAQLSDVASHADRTQLAQWAAHFKGMSGSMFVVRTTNGGEDLVKTLKESDIPVHLPFNRQEYDLISGKVTEEGIPEDQNQLHLSRLRTPEYIKLVDTASELASMVRDPRLNQHDDLVLLNKQMEEIVDFWHEKNKNRHK